MHRHEVRRAGIFAFAAFSLQLLLGASALPCAATDHAAAIAGAQQSSAMAGMPMPDTGTTGHTGGGCDGQQTAPSCQSASACTAVAIPAAVASLAAARQMAARPGSLPTTLHSALIAPDLPPPRA